jgi:hypothetical protein
MAVTYLSQEWLDECRRRFNSSAAMRRAARGSLSITFQHRVTGVPGGPDVDFYSVFREGKSEAMSLGVIEAPEVFISADYATWKKIHTAEEGMVPAFLKRDLHVKTRWPRGAWLGLKHFGLFRMSEIIASIPTDY